LFNRASGAVDDQARAAEVILDQPVGLAALDQVIGRIPAGGVDEAADDLVVAVEFGGDLQGALIQKALSQDAVDFLADTPVLAVDQVVEGLAVRQGDLFQVAEDIVVVARGLAPCGFCSEVRRWRCGYRSRRPGSAADPARRRWRRSRR
jgi:hypothetical protein